ncbi:MAG: hypothetical protein A2284_09630 [Deltaproteobacteria bacterium RIFOXYA12_FULL_61_11]|nr:MAG: hypothetical protein A2284_09630 [Deltaproteobacteria bacterium RIFOXYA12_FULL_61_11]
MVLPRAGGAKGEVDGEGRTLALCTFDGERAVVFSHDAVANGQAEAGAFADRFGGEVRVEDAREAFLRDAFAVVRDRDLDPIVYESAPHDDQSARRTGLDGVDEQVEHNLVELRGRAEHGPVESQVLSQGHPSFLGLVSDDTEGGAKALVQVRLLELGFVEPRERPQVQDDVFGPLQPLADVPEQEGELLHEPVEGALAEGGLEIVEEASEQS